MGTGVAIALRTAEWIPGMDSWTAAGPGRCTGRGLLGGLAFGIAAVTSTLSPAAGGIAGAFPFRRRGRALTR